MIKTIIIDDEPGIRKMLSILLKQHCHEIHILAEADGVESGYKAILAYRPDLIFLDIRLDDGTGFDLLHKFEKIDFHVIFITAFEQYAVRAFRFSAIDYLLKPVDYVELVAAVEKVKKMVESGIDDRVNTLIRNLKSQGKSDKKIVLRTAEKFHFIPVNDIIHCTGEGNYTNFILASGEQVMVSKTIREYEELLEEYGFFRPHKSYLVNLAHITGFEKGEGGFIILTNNHRIPISYRKKDEFLRIVNNI